VYLLHHLFDKTKVIGIGFITGILSGIEVWRACKNKINATIWKVFHEFGAIATLDGVYWVWEHRRLTINYTAIVLHNYSEAKPKLIISRTVFPDD
jgi:hypothetical protein